MKVKLLTSSYTVEDMLKKINPRPKKKEQLQRKKKKGM